jgi:hypothetical protein
MADTDINPVINTQHSSKWQLTFSNVPTIENTARLSVLEQFVQSIVLPDYSLQELTSSIKGATVRHPVSRNNENLAPLTLTMKLSEGAENYIYLLKWMLHLRYPTQITTERLRDFYCDRLTLHMLDNQKREVSKLYFTKAWPTNLSSLSFDSGTDSETTFTLNLSYEEMGIQAVSVFTS